ncbi:MAG TPA: penicillin acylase family protein [Pyrinomonadaceae bacterium]|nr:penicillin acylase family protein [Pyrinomonadaceae bacterium]
MTTVRPNTTEYRSVEVSSLSDSVKIRRDERGIPYIDAANDEDLFFAQGYATASDRLWQMDFLRRTARGELAEILGPVVLEVDKLHRIYGFKNIAEIQLENASTQTLKVLEAYARGVNFFIKDCDAGALPLEFRILGYKPRAWTVVDSLALGKLFAEKLSFSADVDLLRALLSDLPDETFNDLLPETSPLDVIPDGQHNSATQPQANRQRRQFNESEIAFLTHGLHSLRQARAATGGDGQVGSNSWVISGELSTSASPMLASDPHLPATSPSIWHITHLSTKEFRVCGVSVPGVPGVMIGHNEWIAWGITNLCPDVQDVYIEQFDANDASRYQTPAGLLNAELRVEEIVVRNPSATTGTDTVRLEVKTTRHGPVIFESGSTALSLRWTAFDTNIIDLDTFLGINRARNWNDFVAALSNYGGPPQNFTYTDTAGHIGFYSAGRIPVRQTGDGSVPYDGTTDDGEWVGYIPFEELAHAFDPPNKFVVMANQRTVNDDYPHHVTHNWRVPYRAHRIKTLIEQQITAKQKFSVDDFLSIQGDTYSYPDALFASEVARLLISSSTEMSGIFKEWDGVSSAESLVMPLVTEMRKTFRRHLLTGKLGSARASLYEWRNESTFIDRIITERPRQWLPAEFESYESLLLECHREAVNNLAKLLGPDPEQWTWGRLVQVRFPHPLEKLGPGGTAFAVAALPQNTGGSMPTVNAGSRVSMRFIVDAGDWDATRLCLPLGESGDSSSPHRDDQMDEWYKVTPRVIPFNEPSIASAARTTLVMNPLQVSLTLSR